MFLAAQATAPFGLLGLLIVVGFLVWLARSRTRNTTTMRECPSCKKRMRGDATVCPYCQRESTPWTFKDGRWWRMGEQGQWEYLRSMGDGGSRWVPFQEPTANR